MLVYAWHLARSRPRAACLVFGTMHRRRIAGRLFAVGARGRGGTQRGCAAPALARQVLFWRELLTAASAGADARLQELLLGGIQRLAAETLGANPL